MAQTKRSSHRRVSPAVAIVVSLFNDFITKNLLEGCLDELTKRGVPKKNVSVHWVPGSFEIPVLAQKLAQKKSIDAVICLGAVIRGETYHFELVCQGAMQGIMQAQINTGKPIIFGVLSTETIEQAYQRSDDSKGENKGRDAAEAALHMIQEMSKV